VQPVGQLYQHDAHVVHHGQQHLADVFRLPRLRRHHVQPAYFCDPFDEVSDVGAEALFDARHGIFRVFDGVVEQRRGERRGVQAQVGEDVRDFQQVRQVWLARTAQLVAVPLGSNLVSSPHHPRVFGRAILAQLFEQLLETRVELAHRAVAVEAQRQIAR